MKQISRFSTTLIILVVWLCLTISCKPSNREVPDENRPLSENRKEAQSDDQCLALGTKIEEIDARILRGAQIAEQSQAQARETCRGDSLMDCGFWTSRAQSELREIREMRQEKQSLLLQRARLGCK